MVSVTALKLECSPLSLIQTFDHPVTIVQISGTMRSPVLHLNWHGRVLRDVEIAGLAYPRNAIPLTCRQGGLLSWITGRPHVVYTELVYHDHWGEETKAPMIPGDMMCHIASLYKDRLKFEWEEESA